MKTDFYRIYQPIMTNLEKAFSSVMREGVFIGGHYIDDLEKQIAGFLDAKEVICCKSGTHALMLSLLAAGIGPGDEVITIGTTYYATAKAITNVGARCVFVDCIRDEGYLDEDACLKLITDKTKAIIPVHLYGYSRPYTALRKFCQEHDIAIIEDCSHAFGSKYNGKYIGSESEYACFSMYPTKNFGGFGDAGFVATTDSGKADRMRRLRYYADSSRLNFDSKAIHGRMDTIQAALLSEVLKFYPVLSERRKEVFTLFQEQLNSNYKRLLLDECCDVVPYEYPVLVDNRDELFEYFRNQGIPVQKHYATMLHELAEFNSDAILPNTVDFNNRILCFPVIPDEEYISHSQEIIKIANEYM